MKKEMEQRLSEIEKEVKDYEHNKNVTTFLKLKLEEKGLKFIGEDISLPNAEGEECRPDLVFLCENDFAVLVEVKSSLPSHYDIPKEDSSSTNQEEKDDHYNMFVKKMKKKENCFKKLREYSKHEIIFVVHDQDKHKFSEMVFPPNTRKELTFMLARDYNFQLWYWAIQKDKKDREMIKVEPIGRTHSTCEKLAVYPYLGTESQEEFIYATELVKFIRHKPLTEYTMAYILLNIQGLIRRSLSKSELPEYIWMGIKDIHETVLGSHESISGKVPRKRWIKEALEELVELGYVDVKQNEDGQYRIPLSGRWAPKSIYEDFSKRQILKKYGFLRKRIAARKRRTLKEFYIPNATYNQIKDIVLKVYESGGIITKDELKKRRNSADIHQEKNVAWDLGFIEERDGEILITKLGIEYAESDDFGQKSIFHDSAINKIPLYRIMVEKLREKKFLTKEQVRDEIQSRRDDPYSKTSLVAISNTIMNWLKNTGHCGYERQTKRYRFAKPENSK